MLYVHDQTGNLFELKFQQKTFCNLSHPIVFCFNKKNILSTATLEKEKAIKIFSQLLRNWDNTGRYDETIL